MKYNWIKISLVTIFAALLQSCLSVKDYERPQEIVNETYFRTDRLPEDSVSIADFSYTEVFRDKLLQGYIQRGLENNIDIRIALQNIARSEAYVRQAEAAYFPSLRVGPTVSRSTPSMNTQMGRLMGERNWVTQFDLTANATWEADIWGKLKSAEKAQVANYLQTVAVHKAVKSQIVSSIASLYFQLLALDEQYETTASTIALQEKGLETTKALKIAGTVTEVAVKQTDALMLNYKSKLIEIENARNIVQNQLCYLMGETPHEIQRSTIEVQYLPVDMKTGFSASLLRNRPDVMAAEFRLIEAFQNVQIAQMNLYPSLSISANGGLQSLQFKDFFSASSLFASIAGGLTQPIFQQKKLQTQKEVSEINEQTALLQFQQTLLLAGTEVSNALQTYDSQDAIIELKIKENRNYGLATEYSQELLNYGMANYLEVLTAQQNALNAKFAEINAKYSKLNAMVDLYSALGGGWR